MDLQSVCKDGEGLEKQAKIDKYERLFKARVLAAQATLEAKIDLERAAIEQLGLRKEDLRRSRQIGLRLTEAEYQALAEIARATGRAVSDVVIAAVGAGLATGRVLGQPVIAPPPRGPAREDPATVRLTTGTPAKIARVLGVYARNIEDLARGEAVGARLMGGSIRITWGEAARVGALLACAVGAVDEEWEAPTTMTELEKCVEVGRLIRAWRNEISRSPHGGAGAWTRLEKGVVAICDWYRRDVEGRLASPTPEPGVRP